LPFTKLLLFGKLPLRVTIGDFPTVASGVISLLQAMLHTLKPNKGATKKRYRVARGPGSGAGTTAGRGTKGQQSRTGKGRRLGFEGGQTPLIRRQPKIGGFTTPRRKENEVLNIETLEKRLPAGTYDIAALASHRLISGKRPVKVLGKGTVSKKFVLTVHSASKTAKDAIAKAGGSVTFLKA
jgi:large subunit ribosomal protein L15